MTLKEKLHKIYETVDAVEKRGENTMQHYKYIKAADVTNAIRKQFTALKVYAEINFDFVGGPYTIARAKDKDAPFSAVNVKCSIMFHDLESDQVSTSSGLGTGADTGDKAAYKAMTGALKYALKNAFLVPDEADPEADESVDEAPSFQDSRHSAPRPTAAPAAKAPSAPVTARGPAPVASSMETTRIVVEVPVAPREPGDGSESDLPSEEDMNAYRKRFKILSDSLSEKRVLQASKGLPVNVKIKVFLLQVTGAPDAKQLTISQWNNFFQRVDAALALEEGLKGLAKLINKANGIETKK
jgi:hypothetical protein